jgi:hypothetical protein
MPLSPHHKKYDRKEIFESANGSILQMQFFKLKGIVSQGRGGLQMISACRYTVKF